MTSSSYCTVRGGRVSIGVEASTSIESVASTFGSCRSSVSVVQELVSREDQRSASSSGIDQAHTTVVVGPKRRRVKPQCAGPSTTKWSRDAARAPDSHTGGDSVDLPVKVDQPTTHTAGLSRWRVQPGRGVDHLRRLTTRAHNRLPLLVDEELTAYLQCEFAFRPRTPELLPQMAGKARQFLARYDCSDLTWKRRAEMVIRCVGAAMDVTQQEYEVRQHLRDPKQCDERDKQMQLLTTGLVSRGGLLSRSCKLSKVARST